MIYIEEILRNIFKYNNIQDHAKLSVTCKSWRYISYSDYIWRNFYIKYLDMNLLYNIVDNISETNIWRTLFYKRYFIEKWINDIIGDLENIPIQNNADYENNYCVACYYEKNRSIDKILYSIHNRQTMCIICHKHVFDYTQIRENQLIFKRGIKLSGVYYVMYAFYNYIEHYISLIFHNVNNKNILYYKQYALR